MRSIGITVRPQSNIHQLFLYSRSLFRTPRVPTEHEIKHSLKLMSKIPLEELGLKHQSTKPLEKGIEYLGIYDGDDFDIGMFRFSKGCKIPIHDHPGMTVLTRVLYGELRFTTYDLIRPSSNQGTFVGQITDEGILEEANGSMFLLPNKSNLHQLEALSDCAILDLLAPPYAPEFGRPCNYYRSKSEKNGKEVELEQTQPPWDMVITRGVYRGINPQSNNNGC